MTTRDSVRRCERFLAAARRITSGIELQRQRVIDRTAAAPRLPMRPGQHVIDLRGDFGNDIDYYVYELARLQDLANEMCKKWGAPADVVVGLATFDAAVPALRKIRNPLTHPSDDARLDAVAWFDAVVKLHPDGAVEYLVDPRYEHHDAAVELSRVIREFLERELARASEVAPY